MGRSMNRNAAVLAASGLALMLSACAEGPGALYGPEVTPAAPPPAPAATASPQASPPTGQGGDSPLQVTVIPLGKNNGVEARFPINGYYAAPGMEITFDASGSVGAISKYEWDFDGDGTYDATTTGPAYKHTYEDEFEGELALRVSNPIGSTHVLRVPVHVSTKPFHQQLAPPGNVQAEALTTVNGISTIKVTWESDDPAADSWAVAINGMPVGRIEKTARSVTVTDIQRDEDVSVEIFGLTAGMEVGRRAGTTLPAAK
ncbi:MAG TPA: PKD domain-containing protein [Arthrobacter sp.]|nr:PKD domain-containing protein [Arthrobacter sp.]